MNDRGILLLNFSLKNLVLQRNSLAAFHPCMLIIAMEPVADQAKIREDDLARSAKLTGYETFTMILPRNE